MRRDPEHLLAALDPEQQQVARALTGPVVVIAGAGTGKTRAITHRIAYGVATGTYAPRNVLALTFTTRAAGELRSRLSELGAPGVQARTFHSAALRQAQYFWPRIHGGELPPVLDNPYRLVAGAAQRLGLEAETALVRDLLGEISWAKVNNADPERYAGLARAQGREVASADPEAVARVFTAYEDAKREAGRIDFDDILLCTAALLAQHEEVAAEFRRNYRHLVVDEYQDTSPLQQRLLELWRGPHEELCVVGDPAQTIHTFAGARAEYLTSFTRRHPDATVVRLHRDYRSTPQVVQVANRLNHAAGVLSGVQLVAQQPSGPAPIFTEAPDEAAEAAAVADWLKQRHEAGVELREMAVLFRINAQSPVYEQALSERGLSYVVRGGERFYERAEVRQGLGALRGEARNGAVLGEVVPDDPVQRAVAVLRAIGWTEEPPSGSGAVRERWESWAALAAAVEDLAKADPEADFALLIGRLEDRAADQHVPQAHGVTLGTLHSAKGLEWDAVALVGVHEGSVPFVLAQTPDEIAEERRLLYVGVTRARRDLWISWSTSRSGGGRRRSASRFLDGIRPQSARTAGAAKPRKQRRRGTALSATCRTCGTRLVDAAERKVGRCSDCPPTYDENTLTLLKEWRRQEAAELRQPAYCVFTDATLIAIAEAKPTDDRALRKIHGIGATKAERYGETILTLLSAGTLPTGD
ncbi:ATP-dependent DNA helicase UvrD2 [Enemella sp. A6]|uniref:ATP-dependent DNA helicase UvrD2 n=1 Tax=Enemella sp. A6 TaxID=3440152 RepID=UPI003EBFF119